MFPGCEGWGGARGGQGGCLGRAGDQAGVELRVGPSLPLLVWNCRVHGPGLGLGSSVNPTPLLAYWGTPSRLAARVSLRSKPPAHPTEAETRPLRDASAFPRC